MQKILDIVVNSAKIGFHIFFVVGVIVISRYCIGIGYFPAGLDVGDVLLILLVAIFFGLIFVVYFLSICSVSLFLVWCFRCPINWMLSLIRLLPSRKMFQIYQINLPIGILIFGGILIAIFIWVSYVIGLNDYVRETIYTVVGISLSIIFLLLLSEDREPAIHTIAWDYQSREGQQRVNSIVILLICALTIINIPSDRSFQFSRLALIKTSVAKLQAEIYLDRKMESVFNGVGTVNNDYLIIKNADILWTGVGSRSVIEVEINDNPRRFVVNTDEMLFSY